MNQEVNRKKMMMSDLDCYREIFSKWLLISPVLFTFVLITFSSLWFVALWLSSDSHCCKFIPFRTSSLKGVATAMERGKMSVSHVTQKTV